MHALSPALKCVIAFLHWCIRNYLYFWLILIRLRLYVTLEHKKQHGIIGAIARKIHCMGQNYNFFFYAKIIRILRSCSMKIFSKFPTVNISELNFWLVICIAKNFIWTTLKMIFSIFRFFCPLRFQIFKYFPIITNYTSMERLYIQLSDHIYISISKNWPSRVTYGIARGQQPDLTHYKHKITLARGEEKTCGRPVQSSSQLHKPLTTWVNVLVLNLKIATLWDWGRKETSILEINDL